MDKYFVDKLEESKSIGDIFELIKEIVWKTTKQSRAGLDLGLVEMGNVPEGFLGAYYVATSNIIIMNETPLNRIKETDPNLLTPYIFSVLMHEYLHSLGIFDEEKTRIVTYQIVLEIFGENHIITQLSKDMRKFFPNLIYPTGAPPKIDGPVKLVKDFDKSCTRYIG